MPYLPETEPFATVLHVDDDWKTPKLDVLQSLRMYLEWCGFRVVTEARMDPAVIQKRVDKVKPRVLIVDIMDPHEVPIGVEVMRRFRDSNVCVIGYSILNPEDRPVSKVKDSMIPVVHKGARPEVFQKILSQFPRDLQEQSAEKMQYFGFEVNTK